MTQDIAFRQAEPGDADTGARLILYTLHQFGDYLFGLGEHVRAAQALSEFFSMDANRFSYQYTYFCELDGEIAGILMLFNRVQMGHSMLVTAAQMFRVYSIKEILKFLELMLPYRDEEKVFAEELYIAHLAVDEKFRRRGIGFGLLKYAQEAAIEQRKARLSLLTEIENAPARALYEKFGLRVTDTIILPEQMRYSGSKGDVRMEKNLLNI
jgi:ribosomal protein S18 acetylase RimI-like enzyme